MSSKKIHNDGTGPERRPEKYDEQEADSTTATTGQASHDEDALANLKAQ
jgi:molecular chaperone GrpE